MEKYLFYRPKDQAYSSLIFPPSLLLDRPDIDGYCRPVLRCSKLTLLFCTLFLDCLFHNLARRSDNSDLEKRCHNEAQFWGQGYGQIAKIKNTCLFDTVVCTAVVIIVISFGQLFYFVET